MNVEDRLKENKKLVDEKLGNMLNWDNSGVYFQSFIDPREFAFLRDFVLSGGKRLRPSVVIETCRSAKGDVYDGIVTAAASMELFHNSTLVHDDIMDEDLERRNSKNILGQLFDDFNSKFSNPLNHGIFFYDKRQRYVVSKAYVYGNILGIISDHMLSHSLIDDNIYRDAMKSILTDKLFVNLGQIMDIDLEKDDRADENKYTRMITGKTAHLYKASAELGAILANADYKIVQAFGEYGLNIGIAFQIRDDIFELKNSEGKGHMFGSDIKEGKKTLIAIKALEKFSENDLTGFVNVFGNKKADEVSINNVVKSLEDKGIFFECNELAKKYVDNAKKVLDSIDYRIIPKERLEFHYNFADYVLSRNN